MASTPDGLNVYTDKLATAAITSAATQAASAPTRIPPPPSGGTSLLDIALSATAATIAAKVATMTAADTAAIATQTAGLTESPAAIITQDNDGAAAIAAAGALPTTLAPTHGNPAQVWTL